jgi:hypothetical protein
MVCSKNPENINFKMDECALKKVPKFNYLGNIFTEDAKNEIDIAQRIKDSKVIVVEDNQYYALNCTTLLFKILAPTSFDSSLPSPVRFLDPSELLKIQIE